MRTRCAIVFACVAVLSGLSGARAQPAADPGGPEPLVQELARVIEYGGSQSPLEETLIVGLRTLEDPRLSPLFAAMADAKRWEAQIHGVLGMAELSPSRRVNFVVVSEIKNPQVRSVVIAEAVKQELVDAAGLREMLAIPGLDANVRMVMLATIRRLGGEVKAEEFDAVVGELDAGQIGLRVYGSLLAAQERGEDGTAVWALLEEAKSEAAREAIASVVLRQIRDDGLTSVTGFVDKAWAWSRGKPPIELEVVGAMMAQSMDRGVAAWNELWSASSSPAQRFLLAGLLVEFAPKCAPSVFEPVVATDDVYLRRLGVLGAAVADGSPFGGPLFEVLSGEHRLSSSAAIVAMRGTTVERRAAASADAIERVQARERRSAAPRWAFELARALVRDDLSKMTAAIDSAVAAGDARLVELLLTAVVEADPVNPWVDRAAPEMPDRRTSALAALIAARASGGKDLTPEQVALVRRIALGRELLPPAMRVQAAWLALCAEGQEREALARVLAPGAGKPTPALAD